MQTVYLPLLSELAGVRVSKKDAVDEHTDMIYKNDDGLNTEVPERVVQSVFLVSIIFYMTHDFWY